MSTNNESSGKSESMAEKIYSIMRGESLPFDFELYDYYEETHKVYRKPVSHFHELRDEGFTNRQIAQMYGLTELKVRKIIKEPNLKKVYTVHTHELCALCYSRIRKAKKIVDSYGQEVDPNDIPNPYR